MTEAEFIRWYGPWAGINPQDVQSILADLSCSWWLVGGWAIELFSSQPREHEDIDISIRRDDLPLILEHLLPNYCVWANLNGALSPLRSLDDLPEHCRQIWIRENAAKPWLFDLLLTPHDAENWISIRDEQLRRPLEASLYTTDDGLQALNPEMVLHMKAKHQRPKDEKDFASVLPRLSVEARRWLGDALRLTNPDHDWLARL